ncbi:host-nuclease inhibitor Gam family protein [Alistipes sp.]|uniref:host-nuclease inhibitor Gam family protein n=1 Tax=Alistipes sp. TaxID=1872444 RepID=UPI0031FBD723
MARKRVIEPPSIKSWEDANEALRQIAEATLAISDIEGEMNKQILGAKKAAEEQSKPYKDRVANLERELKEFVTENRGDMGKAKSKTLTFGEVSFRLSTAISLPRAKDKIEEIVRRLKARKMMDCIVVKEEVSKEALKKYGEDVVTAVGATWKQGDVFGYELNLARLEQIKSGQ